MADMTMMEMAGRDVRLSVGKIALEAISSSLLKHGALSSLPTAAAAAGSENTGVHIRDLTVGP